MHGLSAKSRSVARYGQPVTTAAVAVLCAVLAAASPADAAGTAYGVDTAEVSEPGNCKVEAWTSWADNRDGLVTVNPACVANLLTPTEISAQITRSRADGEWATAVAPKMKAKLLPTSIGGLGFSAVAGTSIDAVTGEVGTVFAYIPATLRLSEIVRINLNAGWLQDRTSDSHFATYGLGLDWKLTDTVIFTAETFGQLGSADPNSVVHPRLQTGIRWRPIDEYSLDVILGRNINGENANWITVGTTIRFPPQ